MTAARRAPGPKGRRYAYVVASAMSLFVLLACAAFAWRGLHASATLDYPKTSSQGVRCALVRDDAGNQPVRCAAVIDASPDAVWSVVTDYSHFGEIFETRLWKVTVESQSLETDGRTHRRQSKSRLLDCEPGVGWARARGLRARGARAPRTAFGGGEPAPRPARGSDEAHRHASEQRKAVR